MQNIIKKLDYIITNWDNFEKEVRANNIGLLLNLLWKNQDVTSADAIKDLSVNGIEENLIYMLQLIRIKYKHLNDLSSMLNENI